MGSLSSTKTYNVLKREQNAAFFSSIHRVFVTDIHLNDGTINVSWDRYPYNRKITIPLMGLSFPEGDDRGISASWGRYIPQIGDAILVGFDSNGECFALGYHAVWYQGFKVKDDANEARGGIGWGEASGRRVKPGDWDFKSSRGSSFYLGDVAQLKSGPYELVLDKGAGSATMRGQLLINQYGSASELRLGTVRRNLLPTDSSETYIFDPENPPQYLQEWTNIVRNGSLVNPLGIELARYSMGGVVSDETKTVMVPTVDVPTLTMLPGTGVRHYRSSKDPSGEVSLYDEVVDNLGNYGVSAVSAVAFQWLTPAATWDIKNVSTSITSTGTFMVVSPTITLQAATQAVLSAPLVSLGSASASQGVILGTKFVSSMTTFLSAVSTAGASAVDPATSVAALKAIGTAAGILLGQLSTLLSTSVLAE